MLDRIMASNPVVSGTPIERYHVNDMDIYVKREDLCCPYPGPQFSKIRGLWTYLRCMKADGVASVGVLDTVHSKAGWAAAYLANILGMQAYVYFPVYKSAIGTDSMALQHRMAAYLGAILVPMKAEAGYVMYPRASRDFYSSVGDTNGVMLPVGLKLDEAIDANAEEVLNHTPDKLLRNGTWIVSVSSGTIAAAIWKALNEAGSHADLICHMGYSRPVSSVLHYITRMSGCEHEGITVVDEGYAYKDAVYVDAPFPCNPYYDLKAWKWLVESAEIKSMKLPIVFWNIGA